MYLSLCVWYFFNQFEKKILPAELICWQSLHIFFFAAFTLWQCTVVTLSLLKIIPSHISILRKGRAKKYSAQLRFGFIGNDKKKKRSKNLIEVDFHLLFPLNPLSHNYSLQKQVGFLRINWLPVWDDSREFLGWDTTEFLGSQKTVQ